IWLRKVAAENKIPAARKIAAAAPAVPPVLPPDVAARLDTGARLRQQADETSIVLADLIDFHRREEKPMWWRMFDRAEATPEELRDDPGCVEGIQAVGPMKTEKQSFVQTYRFDPLQECKLASGDRSRVMFTHNLEAKFTL